ncbi:hypothetical protein A1O1_07597 [Capronia coronata CBS 617.96]|uniref:Fe2OG dioxygenase domain-containing protein n=1 Tax=Capronia coronata CBS 617.96 TaxID=1182541 RepID=W9XMU0_9EURO|nr:uncharacterized protein A1O1_07597 [Capronia coronata CBS 617.96]EXJ81533.1 hypothetical protein A1O1_07597 [Capronia coronata CBS 617.96]
MGSIGPADDTPQTGTEFPFPIVSFQPFLDGTPEGKKEVADRLYDAFHNFGWVYLKDFGISQSEIEEMFRRSKQFHDQPTEWKEKLRLNDPSVSQGYTADGAESSDPHGGRSHKECYEHRKVNELCPAEGELDDWTAWANTFYKKLLDLASHVASALATVLGLDADEFRAQLGQLDGQLRLLHYMPVARKTLESGRNFRINPHTDYGLFTLLFQDSVGGLEVDRFHDGKFVSATPIPGTCVINVADILQRLSNDGLRSTRHRVMAPKLSQKQLDAIGPDGYLPARYSTAFFVHPERNFLVDPIVKEGDKPHYEPCVAGCWRDAITAKNYRLPIPMDTPEQVQAAKCVDLRYMMAANIEKKPRVI